MVCTWGSSADVTLDTELPFLSLAGELPKNRHPGQHIPGQLAGLATGCACTKIILHGTVRCATE
jgi:hypothetical protein